MMKELSKKFKKITDITNLVVPIDFISYRSKEWFSGKYDDQENMDYILMKWNLSQNSDNKILESGCADVEIDGDKVKFLEVNEGFNVFNVVSEEIEYEYNECVENENLDYFVFYSAAKSTVVRRKLNMGDRVRFRYRGMISAKTALENLKESRSPTSYKFISVNNELVTK